MATDKANQQVDDWLIEQVDTVLESGDALLQHLYYPFATTTWYEQQRSDFAKLAGSQLDEHYIQVTEKTKGIERKYRDKGLWGQGNDSELAIRELLHHIKQMIPEQKHKDFRDRILDYVLLRIKQLQS